VGVLSSAFFHQVMSASEIFGRLLCKIDIFSVVLDCF